MNRPDFNQIEWEEVGCIFCGDKQNIRKIMEAPDRVNNLPGIFHLVECLNCGLVFQSPRPKEEFISLYYPDDTFYFSPTGKNRTNALGDIIKKNILVNYYGYRSLGKESTLLKMLLYPFFIYFFADKTLPRFVENGNLLEIGCSHGAKLDQLRSLGWLVQGVEPNGKAADYARNTRRLDVKTGSLLDAELPESSYDAVIADMVIEHLYQPREAIKKISKILKPGGQLLFSIPYFEGIEFKIFGKYAYALQLPTHVYFYNKKNIIDLLADEFDAVKFNFHHIDRDFAASAKFRHKEEGGLWNLIYLPLVRKAVIKPLVFTLSIFGKTSRVSVTAIKKS